MRHGAKAKNNKRGAQRGRLGVGGYLYLVLCQGLKCVYQEGVYCSGFVLRSTWARGLDSAVWIAEAVGGFPCCVDSLR